jgi:hypothetical protein
MMRNKSYDHIVATVDGSGPRSKFLSLEDMLTQPFNRTPPGKNPEPFHIGMQTITDPARVKIVKKFKKVLEDYVGREQSEITMFDCMYEYHTAGRAPPAFHQDMCTQSLGISNNLGEEMAGTQFLKSPGRSLSAMPTLATTKAFLKDKWEMTGLTKAPLCKVHNLPPGGVLMFDQTRIHRANPQRMGKNKRERRYIFAAYDTFNGHSGTNTDFGPIFKDIWIEQWTDKFDMSYKIPKKSRSATEPEPAQPPEVARHRRRRWQRR